MELLFAVALVIIACSIIFSSIILGLFLNKQRMDGQIHQDAANRIANNKLDLIHSLVNSNMTAALQSELDATVRELAMMKEVIELKRAMGIEPSPEVLSAITSTQTRINELLAVIRDRVLGD